MDFNYMPKRLIGAKEEILKKHPLTETTPTYISLNDELKKLILRLVALDDHNVKVTARALSSKDVLLVAGYLPHNYYKVKLKNLFAIVKYRFNQKIADTLYNNWQDAYINKECNSFIANDLLDRYEQYTLKIINSHFSTDEYKQILNSNDIPLEYSRKIQKHSFPLGISFKEKLIHLGLSEGSKLYIECERLFYICCKKTDYLSADITNMISALMGYNETKIKLFLENLLSELSLQELVELQRLLNYIETIVGSPSSDKFKTFFHDFNPTLLKKYINWRNIYRINTYFANDDRSKFWSKYSFIDVRKYNYSDSIVMETDNHIIVEFLGQGMGPLYIYEKDYFFNNINPWITRGLYNNSEMRQALLHRTQYGDSRFYNGGYRREHRGNWQSNVAADLRRYRVTSKL